MRGPATPKISVAFLPGADVVAHNTRREVRWMSTSIHAGTRQNCWCAVQTLSCDLSTATRRRKPVTTEAVQNHSMTVPGNPYRHHTHRLDLEDPFIREWAATVLLADPDQGIVLDRSAFYPGGGGQPPDHGVLLWGNVRTRIVGTRKGDDLYLLPAEGDPLPPAGTSVRGGLDDERRTSLMRTHSGLHVLSAIVLRDFGAPVTGGNMEPLIARMDFDLSDVPADFKQRVEDACNEAVRLNRQIDVRVLPREQAMAIPNIIRTASDLLPPDIEMVRIVDINGIDVQADGGTHVASTAMIGRIAVTKMESKGRGFRRLRIRIEDAE